MWNCSLDVVFSPRYSSSLGFGSQALMALRQAWNGAVNPAKHNNMNTVSFILYMCVNQLNIITVTKFSPENIIHLDPSSLRFIIPSTHLSTAHSIRPERQTPPKELLWADIFCLLSVYNPLKFTLTLTMNIMMSFKTVSWNKKRTKLWYF